MLTREDGLSSDIILRTIKDPKSEGVFVVTSNSLCYLEPTGAIRVLEKFPYFNNYDIWVKDEKGKGKPFTVEERFNTQEEAFEWITKELHHPVASVEDIKKWCEELNEADDGFITLVRIK